MNYSTLYVLLCISTQKLIVLVTYISCKSCCLVSCHLFMSSFLLMVYKITNIFSHLHYYFISMYSHYMNYINSRYLWLNYQVILLFGHNFLLLLQHLQFYFILGLSCPHYRFMSIVLLHSVIRYCFKFTMQGLQGRYCFKLTMQGLQGTLK